ncbi:MAG: poly-gamma-glutamate system protein [candidate division WOR-3 bacterium]
MRRRQGRVNRWTLVILALLAIVAYLIEGRTIRLRRVRNYELKLAAAQLSNRAFQVIKQFRTTQEIPIDTVNDPNKTGLIGLYSSQTTYGRSDLSDALTTTNPNFSAALVEMLLQAGLRQGDTIAISWDGTYPALNIQLLAVVQTLRLVPLIVTAQSSGMWGANYPGLSWLRLERALIDAGLWNFRSRLATLGGETDDGRGLAPTGREELVQAAESAGVECFVPQTLAQGVRRRLELFANCRALVSVGTPIANLGAPNVRITSKVLKRVSPKIPEAGLIGQMLERHIPVIHIANPSQVAADYRLPIAPEPLPEPGKGRLFLEKRSSPVVAAILAILLLVALAVVVRFDIESYFGHRANDEEKEAV